MKKLNFAIFGAGLAAEPHFKSIIELNELIEPKWIILKTNAKYNYCKSFFPNANITTQTELALQDEKIDAALVLTPPNTHNEIASLLANRNIPALIEKPLEISLKKSIDIVDKFQNKNLALSVMLQHRFRDSTIALKEAIDNKKIGAVISGHVSVRWWRDNNYYSQPGRGTFERDGGGVLLTQAIHTIDLLTYLFGSAQTVYSTNKTTSVHNIEVEDLACAVIEFDEGLTISLHATTAAPPGFTESIELSGTNGSLILQGGVLSIYDVNGNVAEFGTKGSYGSGKNPMDFNHISHKRLFEDFISAIKNNREPIASGKSALSTHQLIFSMTESSKIQKKLHLEELISD